MATGFLKDANEQLDHLVSATHDVVDEAKSFYVRSMLLQDLRLEQPHLDGKGERLLFAARGLETVGLDLLSRSRDQEVVKRAWKDLLWSAFYLRRGVWRDSSPNTRQLAELTIDGLLANRQPELRLALKQIPLGQALSSPDDTGWDDYVLNELLRAFLLLVRKANGLGDIELALQTIADLRVLQGKYEDRFLRGENDEQGPGHDAEEAPLTQQDWDLEHKAALVVAYYNMARAVEITAQYLKGDYEQATSRRSLTAQGAKDEVDKFIFTAREVLSGHNPDTRLFAGRLAAGCKALIDASIYSAVLPRRSQKFLRDLARRSERPVLELWFAQREALKRSLLDPTRLAVVVSMPTSVGKTLLAELAILQAHSDDPNSRIVYLAPTRALVTQVSLTLRRDLGPELRVRVATPSFELNPVEDEILQDDFDILVTTPEKMDLLVRVDHIAVRQISLVVVDEAHNLGDETRGARLELLLATLRRERVGTRFLLLSPFADNAAEISRWLGGDRGAPIVVDWKPNDRVVGAVVPGKKRPRAEERPVFFETLDSAHSDCPAGEVVPMGSMSAAKPPSKERVALHSVLEWAEAKQGGVLLLAGSRRDAVERAEQLAKQLPPVESVRSVDFACRFLDTEAGGSHPLSPLLRKGVAFHHAGLSPEARYLVERLAEEGTVRILCATTTLAQGVHFPLSVAVIESHYRSVHKGKGRPRMEPIPAAEFWNIAGRVARTLEDPLGVIAFSAARSNHKRQIQRYLTKDASQVSSALMALLAELKGKPVSFNAYLVETVKAASAFMQYILHALSISGRDAVKSDLEGLLRASFVYEQARADDPDLADELVRIARLYLEDLERRKGQALSGFARMADGTGFSSASVDIIWRRWRAQDQPAIKAEDWTAGSLFPQHGGASQLLVRVIDTLKEVPEVRLGTESAGEFSATRVARIATAWVNGTSLAQIARDEFKGDLLECTYQVYSAVTNDIPWGLRAVERVAFAGSDEPDWAELDLLPAMVFHGVRTKEAIALRMRNVPRVVAEGLAAEYRRSGHASGVRVSDWIDSSTDRLWQEALPSGSSISGHECRAFWQVLEGTRTWKQVFGSL